MNITTNYKTNSNGTGVIEARSGDTRKTTQFDHSRSVAANHGLAAGALILHMDAKDGLNRAHLTILTLDQGTVTHTDLGDGKHRFEI